MTLDEAIKHCEEVTEEQESKASFNEYRFQTKHIEVYERQWKNCKKCASEHRQLAEWLKELKAYREDTRFADLYERICIKRDDDREYFARTKDKTYITRIAEKEMFIHMMQDKMFDRYGVEEVNADEDSD